jgi:hypothetical protein
LIPFSANKPIIAAVAAATGLAVIACCEAMVAIGHRPLRTDAVLVRRFVDHRQQRIDDVARCRRRN